MTRVKRAVCNFRTKNFFFSNVGVLVQNEKKRKRKMQEKDGKSKKKDFKF